MIFLVFGILAVGLFLVCIDRRRERALRWTLACVSLTFGLYLVEGVLEVSGADPRRRAAWWNGVAFDQRTTAQVVGDLRRRGNDAQPNVIPFGLVGMNGLATGDGRILPLAGISGAEVVLCNEVGAWVTYPADEHGFRNPAGAHRPGGVDLALLGDSFVQGQCVDTGRDIAHGLRAHGYRVVNLGMSGNGPLIQLATLTEYAARLRPTVVIWSIYEGNDAHELARERHSEILMHYLEQDFSQHLASRQPEIDEVLARHVETRLARQPTEAVEGAGRLSRFLHLRELEQRLVQGFGHNSASSETKPFSPLMAKVLGTARRRVEGWGGRLYLLYLPELGKSPGRDAIRRQTQRLIARLDIPLIDVSEIIAAHPDPDSLFPYRLRLRVGVHFNDDGYQLIADTLAARLPSAQELRPPESAILGR